MKRVTFSLLFLAAGYIGSNAQNLFPATGRAGVYSTTPAAALQVRGGARIGTLTNYTNIDSATGNLSFMGNALYQVGNNKFAFQSATQPLAGLFFNATNLRYEFRNIAGTTVFNIGANAAGNVGIGTATPAAKLDISGNIKITDGTQGAGKVLTSDANGLASWITPGAVPWAVSGNNMYNSNSGNVGIGTAAPSTKLQVLGSFEARSAYGAFYANPLPPYAKTTLAAILTGFTDNPQLRFSGVAPTVTDIGQDSAGNFVVEGNDNNLFTVTNNGNVGIGTTDPVTTLDVKESGWFRNNAGGLLATSAGAGLRLTTENNVASIFGYDYSTNAPLNLLLQNAGGNVGIGTDAPAAKLDIYGPGGLKVNSTVTGNGTYDWIAANFGGADSSRVVMGNLYGVATIGAHNKTLSGWADLAINPDAGNVGIGTATPAAKLDVNGDALINGVTVGKGSGNENKYTNTAIGTTALYSNTTGFYNTANGFYALQSNTTGNSNTAIGTTALFANTTGYYNTAIGANAIGNNTTGGVNTAIGNNALFWNSTGSNNTANGIYALGLNTIGSSNTANGANALYSNTTGSFNTAIGYGSSVSSGALTNATAVGANAIVDADNKVRIGNTSVASIGGQVGWTTFSDGRYKKNIKEDVKGLVFINSLVPITYTVDINGLDTYFDKNRKHDSTYDEMKKDKKPAADQASKIVYNGFIAQDVEAAAKKLNYNFSGVDKPQNKDGLYGLRYSDFVVPLVKAVQELSTENEALKTANDALKQRLDKLEALITSNLLTTTAQQSINLTNAGLEQNIPNPFSNTTTINYTLPQSRQGGTAAQMVITDNGGKTIKQINISGNGKGSIQVDASTLASGAYSYSLYIDGKMIDTKQMVLVK